MAGRPAFEATVAQCRAARRLARLGATDREIALALKIDRKTLRRSALGDEIAALRLETRTRLMRPVLADALKGYRGAVTTMLKALHRASNEPRDAENDGEDAEKETKIDGKA